MTRDLGDTTSIDVIKDLVSLEGQFVIDVGCGDMTFSRCLAEAEARVLAVDPDPTQAEMNRAADPIAGIEFVEAGAETLPVPDGSVDGVFFSFSLHHVPAPAYPAVFAGVRRVLKPEGWLCVIEPTSCPLYDVMRFFHDEDHVRDEAQRALVTWAVPTFETHVEFRYHSFVDYGSFDGFATRFGQRPFNPDYTEADVRRPEVEAAFERAGAPDYRFVSPKRMMFLQRPNDRGDAHAPTR